MKKTCSHGTYQVGNRIRLLTESRLKMFQCFLHDLILFQNVSNVKKKFTKFRINFKIGGMWWKKKHQKTSVKEYRR